MVHLKILVALGLKIQLVLVIWNKKCTFYEKVGANFEEIKTFIEVQLYLNVLALNY